ncbi:MAG: hypothetical protein AAF668_10620 [Pseudomonadota bacterium]
MNNIATPDEREELTNSLIELALRKNGFDKEFNPSRYRDLNPDVAEAGIDALTHFLSHGYQEGRDF